MPVRRKAFLVAALLAQPLSARAQEQMRQEVAEPMMDMTDVDSPVSVEIAKKGSEAEPKKQKSDLLIVPIPLSNPAIGTGLTLVGVLFHNPNNEPRPWVTGAGGLYTSGGTWGGGVFHSMSFGQDAVRLVGFGGYVDAKVRFYGIGPAAGDAGRSIDMQDKGLLFNIDTQFRFAKRGFLRRFYVGPRFQYLRLDANADLPDIPLPNRPDLDLPPVQLKSTVASLGPSFTFDSRDRQFAPSKGVYVTGTWMFGAKFLGSDFEHRKFELGANLYLTVTKTTVIAIRRAACSVTGEAPFYDLCMFGQYNDLRGYETGRYRDGATWAVQSEVRQHLFGKFGVVGFAGIGGLAASAKDVWKNSTVLTSGGVGVRYMASKSNNVNLRLDVAFGQAGQAVYFGIGEAF